jgi:hypothetical protein
VIWPTKSPRRFFGLGLKTMWEEVCRFAPQNRQVVEDGVGHASRSSGLLRLEASRARVSQSSLKTGRGVARMVLLTSSWR